MEYFFSMCISTFVTVQNSGNEKSAIKEWSKTRTTLVKHKMIHQSNHDCVEKKRYDVSLSQVLVSNFQKYSYVNPILRGSPFCQFLFSSVLIVVTNLGLLVFVGP